MDQVSTLLQSAIKNNYFSGALTVFLILYASLAKPQLPSFIANLFEHPFFRMIVIALIAYISTKDLQVAILITVVFTLTMTLLNEQRIAEGFVAGLQQDQLGQQSGGYAESTETDTDTATTTTTTDIDDEISSLSEK